MCMITTCWRLRSFSLYLNEETRSRAVIKHHTELAATCQQYCYMFSHTSSKRSIKDYGCEVWIMGERCDPIPGRFVELAEEIIAFIWNGHSAFIWVNGAEGEIFSRSLTLCQHVEKGWLPENKNSCETNPPKSAGEQSLMVDSVVRKHFSKLCKTVFFFLFFCVGAEGLF